MRSFNSNKDSMYIVADDKIPFLKGILEDKASIVYKPGEKITSEDLLNADALLVRTRTRCDKSLLEGSNVRFVGSPTIGYDHIDTIWCDENGIIWKNAPGCNSNAVQQYFGSAIALLYQRFGFNPEGKTIGVIGVGHVGSKVANLAALLGMEVLLYDPPRKSIEHDERFCELEDILEQADVITLHIPLTLDNSWPTYHMIDEKVLSSLNKCQVIINTSRGEVVETEALKQWIQKQQAIGVFDVWENEPDPDFELHQLAAIATPHIAGYSLEGKANGTQAIVRSLSQHFNLGLNSYSLPEFPAPVDHSFYIDCDDLSDNEVLFSAFLRVYDITRDDILLRHDPSDFEELRKNYSYRREWSAYTIRLKNGTIRQRKLLKRVGFKVKSLF